MSMECLYKIYTFIFGTLYKFCYLKVIRKGYEIKYLMWPFVSF